MYLSFEDSGMSNKKAIKAERWDSTSAAGFGVNGARNGKITAELFLSLIKPRWWGRVRARDPALDTRGGRDSGCSDQVKRGRGGWRRRELCARWDGAAY